MAPTLLAIIPAHQLASPMRLERFTAAEVTVAPNLPQGRNNSRNAAYVVANRADGAGRSKGNGKQGFEPGDREVAVLAGCL